MKFRALVFTLVLLLSIGSMPFGVSAANANPFTLEAPKNMTVELKYDQNNRPYFDIKMDVPEGVLSINNNLNEDPGYYSGTNCIAPRIRIEAKYGKYDWNQGPALQKETALPVDYFLGGNVYSYYPNEEVDASGGINIKAEVYTFRASFYSSWGYANSFIDKEVVSGYSNLVTLGNPAEYRGASDWAKDGLDKAVEHGIMTEKVKDNMRGAITREEFAEVAVKLYEVYTGEKVEPAPASTFTDTKNPEILKAYQLGIVNGVGDNKFAPRELINREQMAAMLNRAVVAIRSDADTSIVGAPTFSDEKEIASYFVSNVKFMAKNGFIAGVGNNRFAPKDTSTREQAVIVAVRVYETYAGLTK